MGYLGNAKSYCLDFFRVEVFRGIGCFEYERLMRFRSYRPVRPTYRKKIWDNFDNFWPIELKFGSDPTISSLTSLNNQKIAYREILRLP